MASDIQEGLRREESKHESVRHEILVEEVKKAERDRLRKEDKIRERIKKSNTFVRWLNKLFGRK